MTADVPVEHQRPPQDPAYLIAQAVHPRWIELARQRDAALVAQGKPRKYEGKNYDLSDSMDKLSLDTLGPTSSALWIEHLYDGLPREFQVSMWQVAFEHTPRRIQEQNIDSSRQALERVRAARDAGTDYMQHEWKANAAFELYVNYIVLTDESLHAKGIASLEQAFKDQGLVVQLKEQYEAMDPITKSMDDVFLDVAIEMVRSGKIS